MRRKIEQTVRAWLASDAREPLLIKGARRVGKTHLTRTWLAEEVGSARHVYLDFQTDLVQLNAIFGGRTDVGRIVQDLELYTNRDILPRETILVFDEVQLCEKALNSLRFFAQSPYRVVATGSLLGVTLRKQGDSRTLPFPSDVRHVTMHPLDFEEFLWAVGDERMARGIRACFSEPGRSFALHEQALERYRQYLVVGGMPKAVAEFARTGDYQRIREIQAEIDQTYIADMPVEVAALAQGIWNSIPRQLARESSRKFKYGDVAKGGRASRFEEPLDWMEGAGIVTLNHQTNSTALPLVARDGGAFFKAYMADTGLMYYKYGLAPKMLLDQDSYKSLADSFRGALAENYVMQALVAQGVVTCYWTPGDASGEIEFVTGTSQGDILPIEVKSGRNVRSKTLARFLEKTGAPLGYRISALQFGGEGQLRSIPLYAAFCIEPD